MKRLSYNKFLRKQNDVGEFEYFVEHTKNYSGLTELLDSFLENGCKYENLPISELDNNTSLILTVSVIDMDSENYLDNLKTYLKLNCKNTFIELSCHDHQEVDNSFYEFCRSESKNQLYFIDKNMLHISDDILFFEHHCWHTSMYIPKYKNEFDKLNKWSQKFKKQKKGLFLAGHIRFHKLELLNFLYEQGVLDKDFIWSSTDATFQPDLFQEFIPDRDLETYNNFKILERIPHFQDFDLYDHWKYHNYPAHVNFMNYFNTYFEVVPETQFYDRINLPGTKSTRQDWVSISEKTCKAIRVDIPFVMVSKANTTKLLIDRFGFDFELGFWNFDYDKIENNNDRMQLIKDRLTKILSLTDNELHDFYYEYINVKKNNDIFIQNFYIEPLFKIWNKL